MLKLSLVLSTQPASFSALAYKGELEKNVAKIAALGYDGVELAVRHPGHLEVESIKKILAKHSLSVSAIGTGQAYGEDGLSFTHPDERVRRQAIQRIEAHIELASHFNALVIIGLIRGKIVDTVDRQQAWQWLIEALRECASAAKSKGIRLALEPINRYETNVVNTVAEGLELLTEVDAANLGMLLDTFHMNIEEPSLEESIRRASERMFHVHVADSNRWHPGAGHIDFKRVVDVLQKIRYAGFISAEILPFPDADTAAAMTMRYLRPLV